MDHSRPALLGGILLAGIVAFLVGLGVREVAIVHLEFAVGFALRVVGGLVAVVALVAVLGQWHAGAGVTRLASGGVVILAGVTVASHSWGAALGLAGVLAAGLAVSRGQGPIA